MKNKIGIMGGTFDPIHIGHLCIAQECLEYKKLDHILFIPTGNPNFKADKHITSAYHRQKMVELAIASNQCFSLCDYELKKMSFSYSYETIQYLKSIVDAEFYFIMGEDSLLSVERWKCADLFLQSVHILVCQRSTDHAKFLDAKLDDLKSKGYHVEKVPFPFLDISSTDIRNKFQTKRNPRYYLIDDVYEYIVKERLY